MIKAAHWWSERQWWSQLILIFVSIYAFYAVPHYVLGFGFAVSFAIELVAMVANLYLQFRFNKINKVKR